MARLSSTAIAYEATNWGLQLVAIVAVSIRLYSRLLLTRSAGSDDVTILITLLLIFVPSSFDAVASVNGLGYHQDEISPAQYQEYQKAEYIGYTVVYIVYFFLRTSVILFVLRLLPPYKKREQWLIYAIAFINFASTAIASVSYGVSCIPYRANWEEVPGANCISKDVLVATNRVNSILACICDISVAIIPQFLLWKVQMQKKTKRILNLLFALGLITAALSIGRAATISEKTLTEDTTYNMVPSYFLTSFESHLGVIIACGPALRQAFTYRKRTKTFKPTSQRQHPNEDFEKMRFRINMRDIFWFRNAPVVDNSVVEAHPAITSHAESPSSALPVPESAQAGDVKKSIFDVWRDKAMAVFGHRKPSDASPMLPLEQEISRSPIATPESAHTTSPQRVETQSLQNDARALAQAPNNSRHAAADFRSQETFYRSETRGSIDTTD